jgi:[mycofactocin precursor peptide]-tyrosine decarboxylase / 3-amino-5-[(4-hydroxyphenyl)methyl]-4,4-dimethylpyrrolidin-2-one synthase
MAAKFFTGLPLDGPDPECVRGFGEQALAGADRTALPRPGDDHSHRGPVRGQAVRGQAVHGQAVPGQPVRGPAPQPVPVTIGRRPVPAPPDRACDVNPLAGFAAGGAH